MTNAAIRSQLKDVHFEFIRYVNSLSEAHFNLSVDGKWTAGQQLGHLVKSTRPVALGLTIPGFALKLIFGTTERPSVSFDELVKRYQQVLASGGKASKPFIPGSVNIVKRESLLKQLHVIIGRIDTLLSKYTESELDRYMLPHPLLGKLTLREMMYFTIYHCQHHQRLINGMIEKHGQPLTTAQR